MKKNVLIFGLISGAIITGMMLFMASKCYANPEFESNDVLGYTLLIAAFSFIFVGIKNFRDKHNGGTISFGKATGVGLSITAVAALMYVLVWLVDYYVFIPDYLDKYTQHVMYKEKVGGATQEELKATAEQMASFAEMYQNPAFVVIATIMEVFPIGLVITLISSLILRRKPEQLSESKA